MTRRETCEAVVLQTHNIAEADRFCILFTREHGKIAARARGVRKPLSRMGSGNLLPLRHVQVELCEGNAGHLVTGARPMEHSLVTPLGITGFVHAEQGIDVLLSVLHDGQPIPALFDVTIRFLSACHDSNPVLPYTLCLLHHLGLLPASGYDELFSAYTDPQKTFITKSVSEEWEGLPELSQKERQAFSELCAKLLDGQTTRPLRAGIVGAALY